MESKDLDRVEDLLEKQSELSFEHNSIMGGVMRRPPDWEDE